MKLEEYKTFEEKGSFFESQKIDSKAVFDSFYNTMKDNNTSIFRGVHEAKYKLFTSAQREWLTKEYHKQGLSFVQFIQSMLKSVRANGILSEYYKSLNIHKNDLLYISLLQHYGSPTPMLDFTHDFNMSLYFAIDGIKYATSNEIIDNYVSLYVIDKAQCGNELVDINTFFKDGCKRGVELRNKFISENPDIKVNDSILQDVNEFTCWLGNNGAHGLSQIKCAFLDNPLLVDEPLTMDKTHEVLYWSNINLIAQKGCFIIYTDEKEPLEKYFGTINNYLPKIKCFNIHKSLANYIQDKYLKHLNKSKVYPEMRDMCKDAYLNFKKKLE